MILHQLRRCNFSFTYRVNFSLFTVNINFGVDSNHSESVFYYPDEVEKFSDKENIGSQHKENQLKAQFTIASVQKYILTQRPENTVKKTEYDLHVWKRFFLDSGSGGPGSSPGPRGHCVVFLGKTLYSHSASLHPGVQMGTSKCAGGNPAMD